MGGVETKVRGCAMGRVISPSFFVGINLDVERLNR